MKNKLLVLLPIIFIPFLLRAEWVSLNKNQSTQTPPGVTLISDDNNSTVIKIDISGFELKNLKTENITYQSADLLSESFTINPGSPELPYISKVLAIPDQAEVSFEVVETGEWQTFKNIYLPPARESWIEGQPESPYTENSKAYNSKNTFPNELVKIESPSVFRDFRIVRITVFPLRYIPVNKELQAVSSITVKINYHVGKVTNPKISTRKKIAPSFGKLYRSFIFNYQSVLDNLYDGREEGHDLMLCIMPDDFVASFQPYADWKRQSGTDIHITKFSDIGANSSDPTIIKNHISDAYFNWEIPPTYVLLVGDEGIVPVHSSGFADENYYVEIEGNDFFPEMMIGRFTNQSDYGMQVMINKFLKYEKTPYTASTNWFQKGICCSNNAYSSQIETKRFAAEQMLDYGFTSVDTMMSSSPCNYNLGDVIAAVNEGRSYLNYRGEGWSSGWWASCTPFSTSDVSNLSNGQKFTFVTSIGCGVAMFNSGSSNCFGEEWIETGTLSNPKGAAAFIGPTGNTHTTYNNKIDKGIYIGMFQEGMDTPGQAMVRGKLYMFNVFGNTSTVAYQYRIFCVLGDPSIHIWKDVPREITVNYPSSIPLGNNSVEFSVTHTSTGQPVSNAQICVTSENYFATGITNESGIGHVDVFALAPNIFTITVRGGTAIHFQGELIAVQPSGAYVIEDSYDINDAGGNNNGLMDYGETNMLSLTVKNVGLAQAENIEVTITTGNPYITITDSTANYGNIAPGNTAVVTDGFTYSVANNIPDQEEVTFEVTATNGSDTWTSNFTVEAHAPILEYVDHVISDPAGNNNGRLDPGETVYLIIEIKNSGSSEATNVLGELTTGDQFVTVNSAQMSYGNIAGGAQATAVFSVTSADITPAGHFTQFTLSLIADLEISGTGELIIIVGQIPVLILNLDENGNSAPAIAEALNEMDISCELLTSFPANPGLYSTIFVCLGMYPTNHVLSNAEGQTLANYLNNGGSIYMEGGDTWFFDPGTPVHAMFNINSTSDGSNDMGTIVGKAGTFTEGMSFMYNGDNSWMDHIEAIEPAIKILDNLSPSYGTGIAYDDGDYKTIGTSHEFGGLVDGSSPSTKEELMAAYLSFLGLSPALQSYFSSSTSTTCAGDSIEFYDMSVGGVTSWEWEFEGGTPATSSLQNPLVHYYNPGIYDVSLTVFNGANSNTFTIENFITVNSLPDAPDAPTGPDTVCLTQESTTYHTSGIPGISVYSWVLDPPGTGNVVGVGLDATVFWENEFMGEITLKVAGVNECGTGDFSDPILISRYLPEVTLEPFDWVCANWPAFELTGGTPGGGVYSGSGVENGWFDPALAGLGTHTIKYTYTDPNNCENFAENTIFVDPCIGINEYGNNENIMIFPNPGKGDFTLMADSKVETVDLTLFNFLNEQVYTADKIQLSKNTGYHLDLNYLPSGIYFLQISGKSMDLFRKIVIQK